MTQRARLFYLSSTRRICLLRSGAYRYLTAILGLYLLWHFVRNTLHQCTIVQQIDLNTATLTLKW